MSANRQQKQQSHITILANDNPGVDDNPPVRPVRWVYVGGQVYGFTPETVYYHTLSNGKPYYPYYELNLIDAPPGDTPGTPDNNHDNIRPLWSDAG